jgi:NADH:ubiquinone oxidoreductase subunit F (NADH-binding)/NADH:ubiquinone oxidoreductase subunit E
MPPPSTYEPRIVPGLRRIQEQFGYLKREALQQFSAERGIPLYRLQAVASFFPHFRLSPPKPVTVQVCRDMACQMAGSEKIIDELGKTCGASVEVQGASCLGRCDRAPAACVSMALAHGAAGHAAEQFYLGRTGKELAEIIAACVKAAEAGADPPAGDTDADRPREASPWMIDPYAPPAAPAPSSPTADAAAPPAPLKPYAAIQAVAKARRDAIDRAADLLQAKAEWSRERASLFALAAVRRMQVAFPIDDELREAVADFEADRDWAAGIELGGWSEAFLAELDDAHADLRGMGGAGIPATQKWRDTRDAVRNARLRREDDRAFIVVNGDESEPGTFKDRELLLRTPHLIVESVIVAGLLTDASEGFIYIRHEYPEQIEACEEEIRRAEALGLCGAAASVLGRPFRVSVFVSPGGYICGEQSALIEAMSDRRGEPRNMPPKLETNGLDDQPTLVSNVETFAWVPFILLRGGKEYAALGVNGWRGRRFFSVSGDVNRPGVYEVPMGMTLRELVESEKYCQGMKDGLPLKAIAPSGPSGGFLPAKLTARAGLPRDHTANKTWLAIAARRGFDPQATELDVLDLELELDVFRALSPTQALGAGIVIYAHGRDMARQAVNSVEFFRNESCGKCVPCRIGSQKLAALGDNLLDGRVTAARWESELQPTVKDLGRVMELTSICGLGRSVPVPLRTVADYFPQDLAGHLTGAAGIPTSVTAAAATASPVVTAAGAVPVVAVAEAVR